jgi:hypothetical protein
MSTIKSFDLNQSLSSAILDFRGNDQDFLSFIKQESTGKGKTNSDIPNDWFNLPAKVESSRVIDINVYENLEYTELIGKPISGDLMFMLTKPFLKSYKSIKTHGIPMSLWMVNRLCENKCISLNKLFKTDTKYIKLLADFHDKVETGDYDSFGYSTKIKDQRFEGFKEEFSFTKPEYVFDLFKYTGVFSGSSDVYKSLSREQPFFEEDRQIQKKMKKTVIQYPDTCVLKGSAFARLATDDELYQNGKITACFQGGQFNLSSGQMETPVKIVLRCTQRYLMEHKPHEVDILKDGVITKVWRTYKQLEGPCVLIGTIGAMRSQKKTFGIENFSTYTSLERIPIKLF